MPFPGVRYAQEQQQACGYPGEERAEKYRQVDHAFHLLFTRSENRRKRGQSDGGSVGKAMADRAWVNADRVRGAVVVEAVEFGEGLGGGGNRQGQDT
jgi:hypothetical protein